MANLTGRTYITPPTVKPSKAGILNAADVRDATHELMGVAYDLDTQVSIATLEGDYFTCAATAAMEDTQGFAFQEGGDPFALYYGVACTTGATEAEFTEKASKSFAAAESFGIERHLWENVFPEDAVDLTPAGGPVKPKRALGLLLEWAGQRYLGTPLIHAGKLLSVYLAGEALLDPDSDEAATVGGAILVNGAGYFGKNVGVVAGDDDPEQIADNEAWMYVTGSIVILRGAEETRVVTEYSTNQRVAIAGRVYVPVVEQIVARIRVVVE